MAEPQPRLSDVFPGGCYLFFNSIINWEASEKLVGAVVAACQQGFSQVHLGITTTGGHPDNAFYALNALRALPIKITTYNLGGIRSAGTILFMAGSRRVAAPGTIFLFHESWFEAAPQHNTTSISKRLQSVKEDDNRLAATIAQFTGQPEEVVRDWIAQDLTIGEQKAVDLGIAQGIEELVIPANAYIDRIVVG